MKVYAVQKMRLYSCEVLRSTDRTVRVRVPDALNARNREFILSVDDLQQCKPVTREWTVKWKKPTHKGRIQQWNTLNIHIAFYLHKGHAEASLILSHDLPWELEIVSHSISEAIRKLDAIQKVGGQLQSGSEIPAQVKRLQTLIDLLVTIPDRARLEVES